MARRDTSAIAATTFFGGILVLGSHLVLSIMAGPGYAIPTTIVGAVAAAIILRGPVGQALAKRIHGDSSSELPPDQVLNELDELRTRIAELEERADFSERLLARHREQEGSGR